MTTTVDIGVIANAVELACRAPSLHNSQPWRWIVSKGSIELHADRSRVIRSADDSGREALIGCGAALDHFRVAMAAAGWDTAVETFPDPDSLDHLASVTLRPRQSVPSVMRERADAILRRRTDRLPFRAPDEPLELLLANASDSFVDILAAQAHAELAEAARLTESLRSNDDLYHRELQWWTAPFRLSEGVPPSALVSESERRRVGVNRNFRPSGHLDRRPATARDQAHILVLSTPADTREDAFNCGQALSRLLLDLTVAGMATCTMTHLTEIEAGREVVRRLTGRDAVPQVLIRVGRAPTIEDTPAPTPRRSVREVMETRR
ncbi:nitroreductase family protein [Mycobacterium sp. E740]|uniref:Acg family FMN-binding oxidoreductase n=1 Tax=Mycobacterium sp. E740 TaxID=1834149 RepID=UPI0008020EBD|nr:nitroreductase family protein [Mycobacterium sp. E740]OBI76190.1 NAD(P)H nitroreductase [Mycobacterium sp. E740]